MAITVTRPPPPVPLGKYAKYGPLQSTAQPWLTAVQWYGARSCARPSQERSLSYWLKQQRLLDSALSQTPFELCSFLLCNALFIPNRGKERHLSPGPRPIIFSFFLFNVTPSHRAKLLFRSATFFFNATPWHRATSLSRSAIACVASASVRFIKERGTRVKHRARKRRK